MNIRIRTTVIAVALIASLAAPAIASASTNWSLDVNLASYHLERWARQSLNQHNLGLGVTRYLTRNASVSAGFYRNSYRRTSEYALVNFTPLHVALPGGWALAAGATGGLDFGYRRCEIQSAPWVAAGLLRVVAPGSWSLNLTAVPNAGAGRSGFIGVQMSMPL